MLEGLLGPFYAERVVSDALDRSGLLVMVVECRGAEKPVVLAMNDGVCRVTGYTRTDLIGRQIESLLAPGGDPNTASAIETAIRRRETFETEMPCRTSAGKPFWLGFRLTPIASEEITGSVLMGRDISASLRARELQNATQGLLAKVFQVVRAAVAIIDEHGRILMANPALERLLGYDANALVGSSSLDMVAPKAREGLGEARAKQLVDGLDYTIDARLLVKDGTEVPVRINSTLVRHNDLRRVRVLTVEALSEAAALRVRVAGRIKLVGIDAVKEALGAKWPAVAQRAMASAEHVLEQCCGPGDTFARTEDGAFVICFAHATEEEASFRAAVIAREIRSRLIGDGQTPEAAWVSAITASIEIADQPGESDAPLTTRLDRRLQERVVEIEARARRGLQEAVETAQCALTEIRGRNLRNVVAHFAHLPRPLERRVQAALVALPPKETATFDFDRLLLELAGERALQALDSGATEPILLDAGFEIFLNRRRTERYLAACEELDERLRQRLVPVLVRIPHGTPQSRLLECAVRLRSRFRSLALTTERLQLPQIDSAMLRQAILVVDWDDAVLNEDSTFCQLRHLVDAIHAYSGLVLVRQLPSRTAAHCVADCGVDMVSLVEAA